MGQVRHGSATTTHAVRGAIQRSQASLAELSKELGINPNGVPPVKWPIHWDSIIPLFGGREDGWEAREAGGHRFEVAAG
jgi:hypothetical protein